MFAHKVIESLEKYKKEFYFDDNKETINAIIALLSNSIKFHFGSHKEVFDITDNFYSPEFLGFRLPYNNMAMTFDGFEDAPKILLHAFEVDNCIMMYGWKYYKKENRFHLFEGTAKLDILTKQLSAGYSFASLCIKAEAEYFEKYKEHVVTKGKAITDMINRVMALLNVKNIGFKDNRPSPNLNKKRLKKGKVKLFTYKTLTLKPNTKKEKNIPQHLWTNRLHLCRGHWQTFTPEKPRFGINHPNHIGTFFVPAHTRGNPKKGVIQKDYNIDLKSYKDLMDE